MSERRERKDIETFVNYATTNNLDKEKYELLMEVLLDLRDLLIEHLV